MNPDEPKHLAPINSLKYELSCALYNLAALYTHLALQNRSKHHPNNDSEAFRTSVNHFQSALGTLDKLVSISKTSSRRGDVDVARQTLEGWREYVKGCIQEIGWQKAVAGKSTCALIGRVSRRRLTAAFGLSCRSIEEWYYREVGETSLDPLRNLLDCVRLGPRLFTFGEPLPLQNYLSL